MKRKITLQNAEMLLFQCCIYLMVGHCTAANILMNAILGKGSHFYLSAAIGEQLVGRGHNVTFLVSNAYIDQARSGRYGDMFHFEVFTHPIPVHEVREMFTNLSLCFSPTRGVNQPEYEIIRKLQDARLNDCKSIFENETRLFTRLHSSNYSVMIYDTTWLCGALIAEELGIPHFAVMAFPNPCLNAISQGTGFNPAFLPAKMTTFTSQMTFFERAGNSVIHLLLPLLVSHLVFKPYKSLSDRYGISNPEDLYGRSTLWLANSDFVGEYPCALPPNVIPVGGLTVKDPEELSGDLNEFVVGSSDHGIIICAFGSFVSLAEEHLPIIRMFSDAFSRLPQRVVWQLKDTPPVPLPPNVKVLSWLPMNDLLGHNNTKALFYHGGHNSFYEAIYHGVPTVTMPIFGDQHPTARRSVALGIGLMLGKDITANDIFRVLHEITSNVTYASTVKRLSAIFQDRPMKPAERAAFWVNHAINHGSDYMKIPLDHLNPFQYYLIDIAACVVVIVMGVLFIIIKCVLFSCRGLRRVLSKKSKVA